MKNNEINLQTDEDYHQNPIKFLRWNETFEQLTAVDIKGVITVWQRQKGDKNLNNLKVNKYKLLMINNRGESFV